RKDSLSARIAAIDAKLNEPEQVASTQVAADPLQDPEITDTEGVDMTRPAMTITNATKDEDIVTQLYAGYSDDARRAAQLTDAEERAVAASGIESMLADSIRAEMTRQVAVLQLAPQQADVVLPRVARLREIREAHLAKSDSLASIADDLVASAEATRTMAAVGDPIKNPTGLSGKQAIEDHFVAIEERDSRIYESRFDTRSKSSDVNDAIAFKEADIARMQTLQSEVDSIERIYAELPAGKQRTKLEKEADQRVDEQLIIRTDLGQRSAFITKEEWRSAKDSLKVVVKMADAKALPADDPLMLMASGMEADAQRAMDMGAQLRKRADRIDDIQQRDSLYRAAYGTELEALRELDRAITVRNHIASDDFKKGERLTYEEVASKVLGIPLTEPEAPLLVNAAGAAGVGLEEADASELLEPSAIKRDDVAVANTGDGAVTNLEQPTASNTEQRGSDDNAAPAGTTGVDAQQALSSTTAGSSANNGAATNSNVPVVTNAQSADPAEVVAAQINQAERALTEKDRVPAHLYENFLAGQQEPIRSMEGSDADPIFLGKRAQEAAASSIEAERASVKAADL
ncbi:MAG TPA: hypothetical protein PK760_10235, partial [Flavobacteriales bacterium]|nr:hypothetical protein [Flavobacteriales bacterium]